MYSRIPFYAESQEVHVVFDSYEELSLKEATRLARSHSLMNISKLDSHTPLPQQMDRFWASSRNKEMFQTLARSEFSKLNKEVNHGLILSGMQVNGSQLPALIFSDKREGEPINDLFCNIEEADQRLIKHVQWCALNQKTSCIVISNDTDVLVLLVHYFQTFKTTGLKRLWQRMGTGEKQRYIPLHSLYKRLPKPLRKVILPAYVGTGCDYISKLGTKMGALNAFPEKYLNNFEGPLDKEKINLAEEYLVNVLKQNAAEKTFDDLRYNQYQKKLDTIDPPPTSNSITKGHIPRWWYLVRKLSSLLDDQEFNLDPTDYGWENKVGCLLPEKNLLLVPNTLLKSCNCTTGINGAICKSKRCSCKSVDVTCTSYCKCKAKCENK